MSTVSFGRYQVIEELGAGGFATVYRGYDPMLDRPVAVKVLHPHLARDAQTRERFVREGRALARVHHPNVVQIFDAGEVERTAYLAMEFVPGRSLAEVARGQPMPLADVLAVVRQIAPALDAIHAAGLVHRDVKPANILATGGDGDRIGRAVLLDLGIAREMDHTGMTATGSLLGTPGFLAPEQVEGHGGVGPRTDIYQLAATVYALLAGRPPFEGDTAQVLFAVAHRPPPDLSNIRPDLPPQVIATVSEALAKDPARRPASAAAFAAALEARGAPAPAQPATMAAFMAPTPAEATMVAPAGTAETITHPVGPYGPPPGWAPPPQWDGPTRPSGGGSRWPLLAGAGVVALLAIGGIAFALGQGGGTASPTPTGQAGPFTPTATAQTASPSPASTATATPPPSASPSPGPTRSPTATPRTPSPTPAPVRLSLPTLPDRQIPVPADLPSPERDVLRLLNRNSSAYIAAVRGPDETPLRDVFIEKAYEQYAGFVASLRAMNQYEVADMLSVSLVEFRIEGPDAAYARTVEGWTSARFERGGRRVSGVDTVYDEEYHFVRIDGRWLIRENTYKPLFSTPN